ncbi:MAG TPA: hypothetical protein VJ751_04090 [Pyrinomonadaceae bacterium]|nr:hypothetical protein [Pyrinomonadaceae bacterium]
MRIRVNPWLLLLTASVVFAQTPNCGCEDKPQINVLAVVNGTKITKQDLSIDTRTQVSLVQDTVIAARNRELSVLINRMLLDAEAKRRGLTSAKLLEMEVSGKVTEPTEAEARAFYDQNKARIGKDFKSVKKDIVAQLKSEREAVRAIEFANALRVAAQVVVSDQQVTPPANEADLARVFATVNGVNITSLDIEQSLLPLIFQVQQQVYAIRKRELDLKINDLLLVEEAKRLGTTPKALIDQNVRAKVPIPSEEQARAFYNEQKAELNGEFSDLKVQIIQYLLGEEERKLSTVYAEELRKAAAVQIYLTEPQAPDVRQLCCNPLD